MTSLDAASVALVTAGAPWAEAIATTLEGASVEVCRCAPDRDLWTTVAGRAFDALLLADVEGLVGLSRALREESRTREVPTLIVRDASATEGVEETEDTGLPVVEAASLLERLTAILRARSARTPDGASTAPGANATLGAIVHDVRVLLGIVVGFACNLRDDVAGPLADAQRDHVKKILDAASDAGGLLEAAAQAVSRDPTVRVQPPPRVSRRALLELTALVRGVALLFEKVAADRGMRLEVIAPEPVHLWGDAMQLKQVVTNLVVNALKFTPRGGRVVVRVRLAAGEAEEGRAARRSAEVRVADTGPGVPKEDRERIFERHVRLARDEKVAGSGIGLAVVREVVAQHDGRARVEDAEEGGAELVVTLPMDLRGRAPGGALLVRESEGIDRLMRALREVANKVRTPGAGPEELAAALDACRAIVVLPRDDETLKGLAMAMVLRSADGDKP
jgi:signal transduction histidine kinase